LIQDSSNVEQQTDSTELARKSWSVADGTHPSADSTEITLDQLRDHELIWIPRDAAPEFYDRRDRAPRRRRPELSPTTMSTPNSARRYWSAGRGQPRIRRAADTDVVWRRSKVVH